MHLSDRIQALKISPIRRLIPYADEAKAKGKKVYHLNIGQPDIKTPDEYFEAIKNFHPHTIAYQPSQGIKELREAVSGYYKAMGVPYEPDEVYITCGGSEALQFAVMILCDPGDEILVPQPFYANYNTFAKLALAKLTPIPTTAETGFHLPPEDVIESLINSKTRAFWISHPCNPTGVSYTPDEINMLCRLAKKHDIFIIADEVYREFIYEAGTFMSFGEVKDAIDRVIMIDSVSKRFSACGARIGCIAIKNKPFLAELTGAKAAELKIAGLILNYPVITSGEYAHEDSFRKLLGERYDELKESLSLENNVDASMPPAFIWTTNEDGLVPAENALLLALAIRKAGVSAELHMYAKGDHGLGLADIRTMTPDGSCVVPSVTTWMNLARIWIETVIFGGEPS